MKLCDFFDNYKPIRSASITFCPSDFLPKNDMKALLGIFTNIKKIPAPFNVEIVIPLALMMLRLSQKEKLLLLKTISGKKVTCLAADQDVHDIIMRYLDGNREKLNMSSLISSCTFSGIPADFLLKFLQNFQVETRELLVFGLLVNEYPFEIYENFSETKKCKKDTESLLKSNPSELSTSDIEAALCFCLIWSCFTASFLV